MKTSLWVIQLSLSIGNAGPCSIPASTFQLFLNLHFREKEHDHIDKNACGAGDLITPYSKNNYTQHESAQALHL